MCSIQRPLDTRSQVRIAVEAEAILGVLGLCESEHLELISSDALVFEAAQNPQAIRRRYAFEVLAIAPLFVPRDGKLEDRARALLARGLKPLDALHLASAEAGQAAYFCTCDDRLLKRARAVGVGPMKVVSPLELVTEVAR